MTKNQKKLLFICTAGEMRSPTAAGLFDKRESIEAKYAGLRSLHRPVRQSLIDWADEIFVFDESRDQHLSLLQEHFDLKDRPVHLLDIPDLYPQNDPELKTLLKQKLQDYLT